MEKRKGFTMIEAVIAMALLSAMTAIFVAGIMHSYKYLMKMKSLTADTYSMMQSVENEVQEIRDQLDSPVPDMSGYTALNYSVFGKPVKAFEVSMSGDYGSIWTLVGENTYEELKVPVISVSAVLQNGNFPTASYLNSSLLAESNEILADENQSLYLTTTYRWYVSKKGYYIRSNDVSDYLNSKYYPVFPTDYQAVGGAAGISASMNVKSEKYLGRHLLVMATPVATSGKMGTEVMSNYLYISGFPLIDSSPKMHLDASLINIDDYDTYLSGAGEVIKWTDFTGNGYNAVTVPAGKTITNRTIDFGNPDANHTNDFDSSYANIIEYSGSKVMSIESNIGKMQECTLFVVVNIEAGNVSNPFIVTNNSSLALDRLTIGPDQLDISGVSGDNWYIIGITVNKSGGQGVISVAVNDGIAQQIPMNDSRQEIDFGDMTIGTDGAMLAEIILYDKIVDSVDYNNILSYLLEKYKNINE